jgi:hypothetical protein
LQFSCNWITAMVNTPITKWYFITEHFQVSPHFRTKLNVFYVIGNAKWRATNVFWTSKTKEQSRKCRKRKNDILFQILSLGPPYFQQLYLVHFSQFQRLHMHYLKIYKTCLKWKAKKTIVEKLKLQNNTKHLWKKLKHNHLHFERSYLAHFPLDGTFFTNLDALGGGLQNCFKFKK